ncbi:DNA polymerase III subunit beta [Faecalicoccus sp.]|uniref:DNA polymerase III subunit beta n=1 Tax=Faecalicoccus sp. TaxID=1971758 RepID=UPI002607D009|nr:DNA polymerase III subunit beta [Faecalicoccus sp.]
MHFSIDRKYFYDKLSVVSRAISVFSPIPALSGICIQVEEDQIVLTGSDSNISIRSTILKGELNQLQIESTGSIVVESKYLLEIVRKLDCAIIDMEQIDHSLVRLSSINGQFQLNSIRAQEYPSIDFSKPDHQFTLKGEQLKQIVSQTSFACSDKDQRPVLTGVNFHTKDNSLYCSATDSYRLARKVIALENVEDFNITIPAKSLNEVTRSISEDDSDVLIYVDHKKAQFVFDKTIIQTRLIDGTFPDVERIIPTQYVANMEVSSSELTSVIDRTNFIRNEKIHLVKMECTPEICRIKTNSVEIGNSDEILTDCTYTGEDLTLSCNGTFMLDALRALNAQTVKLEFSGYLKPIRISNPEDSSIIMIVVPIRSYD